MKTTLSFSDLKGFKKQLGTLVITSITMNSAFAAIESKKKTTTVSKTVKTQVISTKSTQSQQAGAQIAASLQETDANKNDAGTSAKSVIFVSPTSKEAATTPNKTAGSVQANAAASPVALSDTTASQSKPQQNKPVANASKLAAFGSAEVKAADAAAASAGSVKAAAPKKEEFQPRWRLYLETVMAQGLAEKKEGGYGPTKASYQFKPGYEIYENKRISVAMNANAQLANPDETYPGVTLDSTALDYQQEGRGFLGTEGYQWNLDLVFHTEPNSTLPAKGSIKPEAVTADPSPFKESIMGVGTQVFALWPLGSGFSFLYAPSIGINQSRIFRPTVGTANGKSYVEYEQTGEDTSMEVANALGVRYKAGWFRVLVGGAFVSQAINNDDEKVGAFIAFQASLGKFFGRLRFKDGFAISSSEGSWAPYQKVDKQIADLLLSYDF